MNNKDPKPRSFDLTKEYILCSAIWFKTEKSKRSNIGDDIFGFTSCYNIHYGVVICGWRHANCMNTYFHLTGKKVSNSTSVQGFLTSLNRFVDRKEAYDIAKECGQIIFNHEDGRYYGHNGIVSKDFLFSEDVWLTNDFSYRDEFERTKEKLVLTKEDYIDDILSMNVPPQMYDEMKDFGHEIVCDEDNWSWNSTAIRLLSQMEIVDLELLYNKMGKYWKNNN